MGRGRLSYLDTLDDRRVVWTALHGLPAEKRVCVLAHVARLVAGYSGAGLRVKADLWETAKSADRVYGLGTILTNEVYRDLWLLVSNYGLDPVRMGTVVVEFARKPHTVPAKRTFFPPRPKEAPSGASRSDGGGAGRLLRVD